MSLHVLAYNLKRAMQILGIAPLMAAIEGLNALFSVASTSIIRALPDYSPPAQPFTTPYLERFRTASTHSRLRRVAGIGQLDPVALFGTAASRC